MKVIGIVTEYNPFHNGHLYQIEKIKEMYPDSIIIVAMSSHFTERGEISVLSKWDKTEIALKYGVDVVLEIPFVFSCQSADTFSYAAIKMLSLLKIETLVFGSESNNLELLVNCARVQINNKYFDSLVKDYISKGYNYPTSLSKAIFSLTNESVSDSNDLLAVSYIKEILKNNYSISLLPIKRTNSYLDVRSEEVIVSASNVRKKLADGLDISKYVPLEVKDLVMRVSYDSFFKYLKYKIISERESLSNYHLVSEGLESRIYEAARNAYSLSELIDHIKSKRYTYNRVNRILINIFIGFTKSDALKYKNLEYLRILGLSKRGRRYYNSIKRDIDFPVINKFINNDMLNFELKVTELYALLVQNDDLIKKEIKGHAILR